MPRVIYIIKIIGEYEGCTYSVSKARLVLINNGFAPAPLSRLRTEIKTEGCYSLMLSADTDAVIIKSFIYD